MEFQCDPSLTECSYVWEQRAWFVLISKGLVHYFPFFFKGFGCSSWLKMNGEGPRGAGGSPLTTALFV